MEKKIIITIKPDGLQLVPVHLKKPDIMTFDMENINPLEAIRIMSSIIVQLMTGIESEALRQQQAMQQQQATITKPN